VIRETESSRTELEHLSTELRESSSEAEGERGGRDRRAAAQAGGPGGTRRRDARPAEGRVRVRGSATLREQRGKARESQRKRIDARMDELKASYEARKSKLDEARQHAEGVDRRRAQGRSCPDARRALRGHLGCMGAFGEVVSRMMV